MKRQLLRAYISGLEAESHWGHKWATMPLQGRYGRIRKFLAFYETLKFPAFSGELEFDGQYGTCINCGCTDDNPCIHPDIGPCWWVDNEHKNCSHCFIDEISIDPATQHPEPERTVMCDECGLVHLWCDRSQILEGNEWVSSRCPSATCKGKSFTVFKLLRL